MKQIAMFAFAVPIAALLALLVLPEISILAGSTATPNQPSSKPNLAVVNDSNTAAWEASRPAVDPAVLLLDAQGELYNPDLAFERWLQENGYEFQIEVSNGSFRYLQPNAEPGVVVDVSHADIVAWDVVPHGAALDPVMDELARVAAAALESHRLDASLLPDAVRAGHNLPFTVQGNGYLVLFETAGYVTRSRVMLTGR